MRVRRLLTVISVATITLATLTGCSTSPKKAFEISEAKAISIISSETPQFSRVIALANGSAEIIAAMGFTSILIGRDIASTDKELSKVPIVTSGHQVIPEKIISLRPDLVIIDKSTGPTTALQSLRDAGISVVVTPEAWSLNDIPLKVTRVAQALGVEKSGTQLNDAMANSLRTSALSTKKRIAFLYLRGGSAIYLIGGKSSGADSLISAIGSTDVGAEKLAQPFTAMTSEAILQLNPEIILVMTKGLQSVGGIKGLVELPGVAQTDAGKNNRVIAVDDSLLLSFGPRTPDLVKQLSRAVQEVSR